MKAPKTIPIPFLEVVDTPEAVYQRKIESVRKQVNRALDDLVREIRDEKTIKPDFSYSFSERGGKKKKKVFIPRESILSRLLVHVDFQTIYNIALAILAWFFLGIVIEEYFKTGVIVDMSLLWWSFGKFHLVVLFWIVMFCSAFAIMPLADAARSKAFPFPLALILVAFLYAAMFTVPAWWVIYNQLPVASSITIMAESARLVMKMHAFFRERISTPRFPSRSNYQTIEEILKERRARKNSNDEVNGDDGSKTKKKKHKKKKDDDEDTEDDTIYDYIEPNSIYRYAYFLFAPTLIYRETYPRLPSIRWAFVLTRFSEVVGCILYTFVIFQKYVLLPELRNVNAPDFNTTRAVTMGVFNCMVPGTLVMVLGFFTLLHCWMNLMAELTQFADREFYEDWWNAPGFQAYYRKWNLVVHEWLFYYIYLDLKALGLPSAVAKLGVFVFSAFVHELVISVSLRYCLPILAIEFVLFFAPLISISNALTNVDPRMGNLWMWANFFLGNGLLVVVYSREWYTRLELGDNLPSGWRGYLPVFYLPWIGYPLPIPNTS